MRTLLATEHGAQRYAKRKQTVEPLFGNTKHNGGFYRFHRRGRTKVRLEWRLLMMTHNLTKIHRHQLATMGARNGPHSVTAPLTTDTLPDDTPTINGPSHRPRLWATASVRRSS